MDKFMNWFTGPLTRKDWIWFSLTAVAVIAVFAVEIAKASANSEPVVAGTPAAIEDAPWIVDVKIDPFGGSCTGSLVAPDKVLTAAHCIEAGDRFTVFLNSTRYHKGTAVKVTRAKIDPGYLSSNSAGRDMGVLTIPPQTTPTVRLNTDPTYDVPKRHLWVFGWGSLDPDGTIYPDFLQKGFIKVYKPFRCERVVDARLKKNEICAGDRQAKRDSCYGDSGGPLTRGEGLNAMLVGVVSYGPERCAYGLGVYGDVAASEWLLRQIG